MELRLLDSHGAAVPVEAQPETVRVEPWGRAETTFSLAVAAPKKWDAEHPNLYTLEVTLKVDGRSGGPIDATDRLPADRTSAAGNCSSTAEP